MVQNEVARKTALQEIKNSSGKWYLNDISRMISMFSELEIGGAEYRLLEEMNKYPHAILAGWTWSRIFGGLLTRKYILMGMVDFYKNHYDEFKLAMIGEDIEQEEPIWVVITNKTLDGDRVYPLITTLPNGKKAIVLAINIFN